MNESTKKIIEEVEFYITDFLEKAHPVFAQLPVCPFVRKARQGRAIMYVVYSFKKNNSKFDSKLMKLIEDFTENNSKNVLAVIYSNPEAMTAEEFEIFINCLNEKISGMGLVAFGFHPNSSFRIKEIYTRKTPYIVCTVQ